MTHDTPRTAPESADRRWFTLDDTTWVTFEDYLHRPPVPKPRLEALLAQEPHLFADDADG